MGVQRFVVHLAEICKIFNSRVNRSIGCSPKRMHYDRDEIARYQQEIVKSLQKSARLGPSSNDLKLGDYVRYKMLSKSSFTKEVGKLYSRSVHTIVDVKKSQPKVYRIYPTPPKQDRYFYRQELYKVDEIDKKSIPVEKIVQVKTLPNGEKIYECILLGFEKREWLTADDLNKRFVLFDFSSSLDLKNNDQTNETSSHPMRTRKQTKEKLIAGQQMITRSRKR